MLHWVIGICHEAESFHVYIRFETLGLMSLVPEHTGTHQLVTLTRARSLLSVAASNSRWLFLPVAVVPLPVSADRELSVLQMEEIFLSVA